MFDDATAAFLASGCALIIGTADNDGLPRASRGWGAAVTVGSTQLRLLLDADDAVTLATLGPGGCIAVTATDVTTLRSLQVKGQSAGIEPAAPADLVLSTSYCDQFFADVYETDGIAREKMERLVPASLVACVMVADALFDQTPGPGAGGPIAATGPTP